MSAPVLLRPELPSYWTLVHEQGLEPAEINSLIQLLPEDQQAALYYDWRFWARPSQLPPEWDWRVMLLKGGRGVGKTWVGSNVVNVWAKTNRRIALVGRTAADVRDTMIEGESGILATSPPWFMPVYEPAKRKVTWPNGHFALCFSADEPSLLRGPQFEKAWCDELAAWRKLIEAWNNLMFGLRLGRSPQVIVTTTPRPLKVIKDIIARSTTYTATESTLENVDNLAVQWAEEIITQYAGTRLGRQELGGELLDDNPNALWTRESIDDHRVMKYPNLDAVTVAVDPPTAENPDEKTAEAGIVVGGRKGRRKDPKSQVYILDDMSLRGAKPEMWGAQAIAAYHKYKADKIVAESNNGGAMIKSTIQAIDPSVPVELVTASRGKVTRAEPVSTLYQNGRVHHVQHFSELEDQLCEWEPGMDSPDRLDANVWLVTDLVLGDLPKETPWKSAVRK